MSRLTLPKISFSTFDPGSGTGPESVNNQNYVIAGAMAALAHEGHDLTRVDPAVAAVALTPPKELNLRVHADALGDIQKRNIQNVDGEIVGAGTLHAVRETQGYFYDQAMQFAGRLALSIGILIGGATTYSAAEHQVKPHSSIEITKTDVASGVAGGLVSGLLTSLVTIPLFTGNSAVRRRARRELRKQLI